MSNQDIDDMNEKELKTALQYDEIALKTWENIFDLDKKVEKEYNHRRRYYQNRIYLIKRMLKEGKKIYVEAVIVDDIISEVSIIEHPSNSDCYMKEIEDK